MNTRFWFSGAIVCGLRTKTLTPPIVVCSSLTPSFSRIAGRSVLAGAATLATSSFHSAMLLGWMSHGSGGAATSERISGLMSSGTGSVYAGMSRPFSVLTVCADTAVADTANTRPMNAGTTAIRCNVMAISFAAAGIDLSQAIKTGNGHQWNWCYWAQFARQESCDSHVGSGSRL